ncbi:MAG: alpha-L-fucosidase [Planctomycetota bacterium]
MENKTDNLIPKGLPGGPQPSAPLAAGPFEPTWSSLQTVDVPDWYRDAKFGIFIHWMVSSVPAWGSEWYAKWMYKNDNDRFYPYHREQWGDQGVFGYKDFIPMWKAERWNPAAWAELFKASGAKYIVPVAEHHDGFAAYDYSGSDWTTLHRGPKRDIIGELGTAVRNAGGMKYCVSSHRAYNWRFYSYDDDFDTTDEPRCPIYPRPHAEDEPADKPFLDDWLQRSIELVDKYQPDLVWFDWCIGWPEFEPYRRAFAAHYYNRAAEWGKQVVINYKESDFAPGAGVWDIERGQLDVIKPDFWQTDTSICRKSWAYTTDHDYKTAASLVHDLLDIVSKNGCLLLNVGPRADGTIPDGQAQVLRDIGTWLGQNGEAVYGTRPWLVFGEGPTRVTAGTFQEKNNAGFTAEDVRYTRRGDDTLYATFLGKPQGRVTLRSLGSDLRLVPGRIGEVAWLGVEERPDHSIEQDALRVAVPDPLPNDIAPVLEIELVPPAKPIKTAEAGGTEVP